MQLLTWQKTLKNINSLIVQASSKDADDAWQPFPIGMSWQYALEQRGEAEQIGSHENLVLCAVNTGTDQRRRPIGINRASIVRTLTNAGIPNCSMHHDIYYKALPSYKFIVSPEGNGIDCHRHYESLLAGCIPIIEKNPLTEAKYKGCPVLWTVDYSEIHRQYLERIYQDMVYREYDFSPLFLSHYSDQETIQDCGNYWTQRMCGVKWYKD